MSATIKYDIIDFINQASWDLNVVSAFKYRTSFFDLLKLKNRPIFIYKKKGVIYLKEPVCVDLFSLKESYLDESFDSLKRIYGFCPNCQRFFDKNLKRVDK